MTAMLSRDELIALSHTAYFDGCNSHDLEGILATMSADCVMRFTAASYTYIGADAMRAHFNDFLSNFPTINFHNYVSVVDVELQTIATHFTVTLIDKNGDTLEMRNCNFFTTDENGLFNDVLIFNSAPLKAGFEAGSA